MDVYIYDGSFYGFISLISMLNNKKENVDIKSIKNYQPNFIDNAIYCNTNIKAAKQFLKDFKQRFGNNLYNILLYSFLSEKLDIEVSIYNFILLLQKDGGKIIKDYSNIYVYNVYTGCKKTMREFNKYIGLLRFSTTKNNTLVAMFAPETNILYPISLFFKKRFSSFDWIIIDTKRKNIALYKNKVLKYITNKNLEKLIYSKDELDYNKLWKKYLSAITIKERKNYKLHVQNMPKKYWKYLVEKN
ncbi:TIGR03915 family putative DNA repair protein [Caldicellulosiruptoraceae bacterium PP1]